MNANFVPLLSGRVPAELQHQGFVREVNRTVPERRDPRVERLILICWLLIALKHVAIIWLVHHYPVPFHPLWINVPTWLLGALATGIYYGHSRG